MLLLRAVKEQDLDTPSIEKRFAYTFLQQLITYVDEAHEHMQEFGQCSLQVCQISEQSGLFCFLLIESDPTC